MEASYLRSYGCEGLILIKSGTYGVVFALEDAAGRRMGTVMKLATTVYSRNSYLKAMVAEAGAAILSAKLEEVEGEW